MMNDSDTEIAQAACSTVGMIGGPGAMKLLQPVLANPGIPHSEWRREPA